MLPPPRIVREVRRDGWCTGYYENGYPAYHLREDSPFLLAKSAKP